MLGNARMLPGMKEDRLPGKGQNGGHPMPTAYRQLPTSSSLYWPTSKPHARRVGEVTASQHERSEVSD